ncbi:hypothetical protein KB1_20440 [Cutibacterium modestum]|uniref:Uncharacterized protein n=1 Tax=Cutibacterium modestum TaxID=2559073 RepID=A0AAD1KRV4_9ACTN|nr:hypothetical protein KB1_20440 [Cutibacterium modestum]
MCLELKKNNIFKSKLIANQAAVDRYRPRATQALIFEITEGRSLGVLISSSTEPPSGNGKHE